MSDEDEVAGAPRDAAPAGGGAAQPRRLFGRRMLTTWRDVSDEGQMLLALSECLGDHEANRAEETYLWEYYKGRQPVLSRVKEVRPEINNKVVENRAREIVQFSLGYLVGEPVKNTSRVKDDETSKKVELLNSMLESEGKESADRDSMKWAMVGGVGVKLVLPEKAAGGDAAPFELHSLDPRLSFVVYSDDFRHVPLMGVTILERPGGACAVSVYTDKTFYSVSLPGMKVDGRAPNPLGAIPIVEYPLNDERMGCFEPVLPLLDAINELDSGRLDGVDQFVQALVKFVNCEITADEYREMLALGAVMVTSTEQRKADVEMMESELNQTQTQVLKEDLYQAVLEICGMPNRNGGSSTSDTGAAVILRDGWSAAEAHARDRENMFRRSERRFLKLVLSICREKGVMDLSYADVDITFTRRIFEAVQSKAQVFATLMGTGRMHPRLVFEVCGMFADPENAYLQSEQYASEQAERARSIAAGDGGGIISGAGPARETGEETADAPA